MDKQEKQANNKNTLWKTTPQRFLVKDMICMKKLLAICSIFFTACAALTGCGDNNDGHYTADGNGSGIEHGTTEKKYESTTNGSTDSVKDRLDDAADGAGDAGKDIAGGIGNAGKDLIDGAQNAVDDVIDGMDGEKETSTVTTRKNDR